jgi:hypothetical protein
VSAQDDGLTVGYIQIFCDLEWAPWDRVQYSVQREGF